MVKARWERLVRSHPACGGLVLGLLYLLGVLLVSASILKSIALWRGDTPPALMLFPGPLREALVIGEGFLGVWWITGIGHRAAARVAVAVFLVFAIVAGAMIFRGAPSCGCFGGPWVSPIAMLAADTVVLGLLLLASRFSAGDVAASADAATVSVSRLCAAGFLAAGLVTLAVEHSAVQPPAIGSSGVPRVTGLRLASLGRIDIGERLQRGRWRIVFWSHDCPKCVAELPAIAGMARDGGRSRRVALIEVPPYGRRNPSTDRRVVYGRLSRGTPWRAITPFWIEVVEGTITRQALRPQDLEVPGGPG